MKISGPCPTCRQSSRRGLLWLGGGDWLECPDCDGSGLFTCHEQRVAPVNRTISVGGLTMQVPKHHPAFERAM